MLSIEEFSKYYVNLLIIQYHEKPRAKAVVDLFVSQIASYAKLLDVIRTAFTIEKAVGKQLDTVAKYFGVKRSWAGINFADNYFDFDYLSINKKGLPYQTIDKKGAGLYRTLLDKARSSYDLTDTELRTFIKLRILALANEKISYKYLYDEMFALFNTTIIPVVNSDMTIEYYFDPSLSHLVAVLEAYPEYLPSPAGVGVTVSSELPVDVKLFTFKSLTMPDQANYNRFSIGFNSIKVQKTGRWRVVAI